MNLEDHNSTPASSSSDMDTSPKDHESIANGASTQSEADFQGSFSSLQPSQNQENETTDETTARQNDKLKKKKLKMEKKEQLASLQNHDVS